MILDEEFSEVTLKDDERKISPREQTKHDSSSSLRNSDVSSVAEEGEDIILTRSVSPSLCKFEGNLTKLGGIRKNWKRRYFMLTQQSLDYYSVKPTPGKVIKPLGSINLNQCDVSRADEEVKKSNCFKIAHPLRRTYFMFADTEKEAEEWMDSIRMTIEELKKKEEASIGHFVLESDSKWALIYVMLLGIRHTVSKHAAKGISTIYDKAFEATVKYNIKSGSQRADAPVSKFDFDFVDYAPLVFASLREKFGIETADYLISLTSEYMLSELPTPGKSGSFFYFSHDYRFLIKTITSNEFKVFRQILQNYYLHVIQNPNTLLPKFFGLHRVAMKGKASYFVVMANIFSPKKEIHEKYDLKGSTLGRSATAEERKSKNVVFKDLDFDRYIHLGPEKRAAVLQQLESDVQFLQSMKVMDYSFLFGIHYTNKSSGDGKHRLARAVLVKRSDSDDDLTLCLTNVDPSSVPKSSSVKQISKFNMDEDGYQATNENNEPLNEIYYFGIIDIFQEYTLFKQIEHSYKVKKYETEDVSSVDPSLYAARFKRFITSKIANPKPDGTAAAGRGSVVHSVDTQASNRQSVVNLQQKT